MKVLSVFDFAWLLNDHLKLDFFPGFLSHDRNNCFHVTSLCSSTSTLQMPRILVMELTKIQDCRADVVQAAKIKILAPQKLVKDCFSGVVKIYK